MTPRRSPTVRHRRLGQRLRDLRLAAGYTEIAAAAKHAGWSESKLNRIERAIGTLPQVANVTVLLDLYGIDEADPERDEILDLTRQARGRGWWRDYQGVMSEPYATYVGLEAETSKILSFESEVIPGLLQTEPYFRALMAARAPETPPEVIDQLVAVRLRRQQLLTSADPVRLWAIIAEGALRRLVGGAEVMADQLEHLRKAAQTPNVTVQIAPFTAGALPAAGPFSILTFRDRDLDPETVYLETQAGDSYVTEERQVAAYLRRHEQLIQLGTKYEQTLAMLAALGQQAATDGDPA
ncbi:helix-turn-helix domain-containing protein [Actinomadura scrupuli]|uniref:helix-turn-helix domain-containing protein n=1 Tax=Actinomadura scrupuli TaxID=559629 RepID=UPI003D9699F2